MLLNAVIRYLMAKKVRPLEINCVGEDIMRYIAVKNGGSYYFVERQTNVYSEM